MYSHFHAIKNVLLLFTLCHFDQCRWNYFGSDATINVCISTQTKRISSSFSFCKRRNRILVALLHLLVEIVKSPTTLKEKNEKNIHCVKQSTFPEWIGKSGSKWETLQKRGKENVLEQFENCLKRSNYFL